MIYSNNDRRKPKTVAFHTLGCRSIHMKQKECKGYLEMQVLKY